MPQDQPKGIVRFSSRKEIPKTGKSWFFGIGINKYQFFSPLNNAVKDVQDISQLLLDKYDIDEDHTKLFLNEEASRENIIEYLDYLEKQVGKGDKLIIYYSGHGHLNKNVSRGYWIPVDAQKGRTAHYIRNTTILDYLKSIQSQHTLLISDSCFAGSLFVRQARRSEVAMEEWASIPSRWGLCSGRHDEEVLDGPTGGNSPFAEGIIQILGNNRHFQLNIGRLADEVVKLTKRNYTQTPEGNPLYGVGDKGGQYIFQQKANEKQDWEACLKEGTLAGYQAFVTKYPNSSFANKAKEEIAYLKEEAAWQEAQQGSTIWSYGQYCRKYPQGRYFRLAREIIQELEEEKSWKEAVRSNRLSLFLKYLEDYPNGKYAQQVQHKIDELSPQVQPKPIPDKIIEKTNIQLPPKNLNTSHQVNEPKRDRSTEKKEKPTTSPPLNFRAIFITISSLLILVIGSLGINQLFFSSTEDTTAQGQEEQETGTKSEPNNMVFIQGGTFQMGSNDGQDDEKPVHSVTVGDFYLGRHEVTFEEYDTFCDATGKEKSNDRGWGRGKRPVINVSWYDAIEYCNWLSEQQGFQKVYSIDKNRKDPNNKSNYDDLKWIISIDWNANGYRLPTEAEWEYAARSRGKDEKWAGTSSESQLKSFGNYSGQDDGYENTAPVGSFSANDLGLYDMSGNVWEWCWDWYASEYYTNSTSTNPKGPSTGSSRVPRGGSWYYVPASLRCANRYGSSPDGRGYIIGFRLSRAGSVK